MSIRNETMKLSVLSVAVQGALAVMFAMPMVAQAAEPTADDVAAIRRPTNFVEIGAENVSQKSAKFGEYSGLNKAGGEFVGNFSLRGGDAYEGGNGVTRWAISGRDLGTTSRELGATLDQQGQWALSLGYDELRHNITDTYQTPQQGSMGGNTFTLPATFGSFNAAVAPSARTLTAVQLGAFHTEDVGTTRKNTSFGAGFNFSPQLSLKFDYNHLAQSGAKLIAGAAMGGVAATTGTWRAEAVAILMNPTNYKTDTFNLALNWVGDKGHLTGAYYGSTFRDGYDRLSWQNPMLSAASTAAAGVYQTQTLSTAPDNQLHQFNLSGGYAFSSATKLVGGLSYGRNRQNSSFLTGMPEIVLAPQTSLNGLVITKHADLKLTHQATRELALSAIYKHNERDNRSSSSLYQYYALNNVTAIDAAANAPYSNKKTQLELAGDYRFDKRQTLRLAYDHEKISRWCNNYALAASNCLVSPSSSEDKLGLKYKLKATDDVSVSAGYSYAKRKSTFDHNAVTPLAGLDALVPTDVNAQDYPGFLAVSYAPRKQDMLKAGVNWQASDKLEFGVDGRYANDKYDATLGVQGSRTTGINLDATYSYAEDASVSAYVSWRSSKKDMRIGNSATATDNTQPNYALLVAPTRIWTNQLDEGGNAFGISTKHKLMGGKLELTGDLSYTFDKSRYSTQAPYLGAACSAAATLTCGDLPDISNKLVSLKIIGSYALDKASKISVGYLYQQLKSDDYFYNWYQYGYTGLRGMPTNQQSGSYSQNVVSASYIYSFK
ncbi:MAG: MtrB/PioB family decaheme-associated outer membrane protein [Rhodocyclales bacterium]|nr:MtrB/PioB family decaheme-associated outer membrane protein [Rhodocyclales bacterium]